MKRFSFRYGDGSVQMDLEERNILGVLTGNAVPPLLSMAIAKQMVKALKKK